MNASWQRPYLAGSLERWSRDRGTRATDPVERLHAMDAAAPRDRARCPTPHRIRVRAAARGTAVAASAHSAVRARRAGTDLGDKRFPGGVRGLPLLGVDDADPGALARRPDPAAVRAPGAAGAEPADRARADRPGTALTVLPSGGQPLDRPGAGPGALVRPVLRPGAGLVGAVPLVRVAPATRTAGGGRADGPASGRPGRRGHVAGGGPGAGDRHLRAGARRPARRDPATAHRAGDRMVQSSDQARLDAGRAARPAGGRRHPVVHGRAHRPAVPGARLLALAARRRSRR